MKYNMRTEDNSSHCVLCVIHLNLIKPLVFIVHYTHKLFCNVSAFCVTHFSLSSSAHLEFVILELKSNRSKSRLFVHSLKCLTYHRHEPPPTTTVKE